LLPFDDVVERVDDMPRCGLVVVLLLALTGCAEKQDRLVTTPPPGKTVAVVVSIPPQIRVATTGMTAFENALDIVEVAEWHLDDVAFDAAALPLSQRYQVSRIMPKNKIFDYDTLLDKSVKTTTAIEKQTNAFVDANHGADIYIVICLGNTAGPYHGNKPNIFYDIGISKYRGLFTTLDPVAHTYLMMVAIDGKTLKTIASMPIRYPHTQRYRLQEWDDEAGAALEGFEWHDHWREMSPPQQDLIRDKIQGLLRDSISYSVKKVMALP